jgi:hypothetical protein
MDQPALEEKKNRDPDHNRHQYHPRSFVIDPVQLQVFPVHPRDDDQENDSKDQREDDMAFGNIHSTKIGQKD